MIDKKTFEASKGSAYMRRDRKAECCRLVTFGLVISSATSIMMPLHAAPNNPVPYHYTGQIQLNVKHVPFSRFGSYLSISELSEFQPPLRISGLYLRTMHQGGKIIPFTESATPTLLTLSGESASVEICFEGTDRLRIRSHGSGLQLTVQDGWLVPYQNSHWEANTAAMKYMVFPIRGDIDASTIRDNQGNQMQVLSLRPVNGATTFETELDAYTSGWKSHPSEGSFDEIENNDQLVYRQWLNNMPEVDARFGAGAEMAAYVNWESVVAPSGNFKRPAMLMSKNWMESVWSWDHAFNAMATALNDSDLAWNQFLLPFDVQDSEGALPDKWDADTIAWEFSKPPIHGWALSQMIRGQFPNDKQLETIYPPLSRWTN